jgi:hypothetical protein
VTSHQDDIENIVRAQGLNSPNVVKAYAWDGKKNFIKNLPTLNSSAIIVEKVVGNSMVYTSSEFITLSLNGDFDSAKQIIDVFDSNGKIIKGKLPPYYAQLYDKKIKVQSAILTNRNRNNETEKNKLSSLFGAFSDLASLAYNIEMSDFDQNIIETNEPNSRYVIIDMGF